jgi:ElaB/YqjD/DUF883 family membrane-anchored ribosome-binding protein
MSRYETPEALRHDARILATDARALLDATSEMADEKVAEARKRLEQALAAGCDTYERIKTQAVETARAADRRVHENPYQYIAIAFGVGALVGFLFPRRSN